MPKTGRPKAENPKSINFTVRLTEELNMKLEKYCEKHNRRKSDVIRDGVELMVKEKDGTPS